MPDYHVKYSSLGKTLNSAIKHGFEQNFDLPGIKKTHEFGGRYENIYLNAQHIPELSDLMQEAIGFAENLLGTSNLRAGYWFNDMPPESTTTLHRHDDYDELLSAVYYVYTPENSGNLILYEGQNPVEIQPEAGKFIFFKPDVAHEVSRNNSKSNRLSIGINFGPKAA